MVELSISFYSVKMSPMQMEKLCNILTKKDWEKYGVPYAIYAFRGEGVSVVAYRTGTVVVQGAKTMEFVQFTIEPEVLEKITHSYEEERHPEWFVEHGGLDESGKGDLFGPLVSACVIAHGDTVKKWLHRGVKDSKDIHSPGNIFALEKDICQSPEAVVEVFKVSMRKYNELYGKFGNNLNHLLAWYHAKSLQNARARNLVRHVVLDQFSRTPLVQKFFSKDDTVSITMRPRAEEDPVVAAASIVARAEYLRSMKELSKNAGEELLRGANSQVLEQAKRLIKRLGVDRLAEFAKLHFSTAQKAIYD
ncbi:MAG: ribonuclease HIII [Puniceicoccales bacterium]|jgi:ribonuclease HIII|nr:ribonuclease HIII [Puniceicoccales bacterium]